MEQTTRTRNGPFSFAVGVLTILTIALFRLPESFVEQLRRNRPLTSGQAGWTYRLLVFMAIAQAAYLGFVILRPERVAEARKNDPKLGKMSRSEIVASIARNAAAAALLSIVYALAAFGLTGERGGYWLFFVLCFAQLAWYFRATGEIGRFMAFQPEFVSGAPDQVAPADTGEGDGASRPPPLARGVGHGEE
jgi:hypothetical protein